MVERSRSAQSGLVRQPLVELPHQANARQTLPRSEKPNQGKQALVAQRVLPRHEPSEPRPSPAVRSRQADSPGPKRIAQLVEEHEKSSKRDSAISTTSTNASGRRRKTFIGHWQLGKTIGKGGCSRVRAVRHRYRDQLGAVKIITRHMAENTRALSLANLVDSVNGSHSAFAPDHIPIPYGLGREIAIMKLLEHPNIVRLYDVWENRNELYLIMELVPGGELFTYVDERKGLDEPETVYIFRQIVSALLYCHRLLICHRDLKPENILLDRHDLSVKLIDFGMAALQPQGRLLSTPCGSPHYAAPEVVSSKPYDGTQADVWSCGVILYVMLTGTTPFNYPSNGDIRALFRDIGRADYFLPAELTREAQDLIRRIFVPDPAARITMDEIWDHPLLHKYDRAFGFVGSTGTKEAAIGPIPRIENWRVRSVQDIDREILGNMRTLWHSDSEQKLMHQLLNDEYNHEKLFYAALLKHREENLENFVGDVDSMGYSASDYHHSRPSQTVGCPPLPGAKATRTQSQYSILNDEHLRVSHSFAGPPPSVSSYDPYRASRNPIDGPAADYMNVTVHRQNTTSTGRTTRGIRHQGDKRIEAFRQSNRASTHTASSLVRSGRSRSSMPRSSISRASMASSHWPSSPPVVATMRPSELHKRGVSFSHLRRTSTSSAMAHSGSQKSKSPLSSRFSQKIRKSIAASLASPQALGTSSPSTYADQQITSRKTKDSGLAMPLIKAKHPDGPNVNIRNEIRKHSAELEKACEEAFFRSSVGSSLSATTSIFEKRRSLETPPTSFTVQEPELPDGNVTSLANLPLSAKDTPNSYLSKTLEETRHKLAAYKANPEESTAKFEEVLRMLENIMPPVNSATEGGRTSSAPGAISLEYAGLPMITEESDPRDSRDGPNWQRAVTTPRAKDRHEDQTIRMVQPSSPVTVAPLSIRKRQHDVNPSESSPKKTPPPITGARSNWQRPMERAHSLEPIAEDSVLDTPTNLRKKRSGWFGLNKREPEVDGRQKSMVTSNALSGLDDRTERRRPAAIALPEVNTDTLSLEPPFSAQSSEFPMRRKRLKTGKKSFAKWIARIGKTRAEASTLFPEGETTMLTNPSFTSLFSNPSSIDSPQASGPERSWFARFFRLKPVTELLCFCIPRERVQRELLALLKEWHRYGVRNLRVCRETNTILVSVGKANSLNIRPVTLRIELFVVLEDNRRSNMSIGRFSQAKGAASGFRRVLQVLDEVMRSRGWLIQDEDKWRALCEIIGG